MTRPNQTLRDLSRDQLRAALGDVVGPVRPGYLADIVAEAGRTRQRPGWALPATWLPGEIVLAPRHHTLRSALLVAALALLAILAAAGIYVGSRPAPVDLGIFEPVAGRIMTCDIAPDHRGLWSIDPDGPSPVLAMPRDVLECGQYGSVKLLGWSSDGTSLLILRARPLGHEPPAPQHLYLVRADGTSTEVVSDPVRDAAISPDGSQVVYSTMSVPWSEPIDEGLFIVDVDGGEPRRLADEGTSATFSPDGTEVAYLASPPGLGGGATVKAPVWLVNVDGTGAHEILPADPAGSPVEASRIRWSPAGDRIVMGARRDGVDAIFTFAPDGSSLTKVIASGWDPYWSPDGSRIAYNDCAPPDICYLEIADADGANARAFAGAHAGPWHPGTSGFFAP